MNELDKEAEAMALNEGQQALNIAVKTGRPRKPDAGSVTMKTNLDLSPELVLDLDRLAEYLGSTRQAVIKGFILQGLDQHFRSRNQPSSQQVEIATGTGGGEIKTSRDGSLTVVKDVV